jgi:SOS-response transcriptional repressor LexA
MARKIDFDNPKLDQVRDAIRKFMDEHYGVSPSIRDIQKISGITSSSVVRYYLVNLEERGDIIRLPGSARGIAFTQHVDFENKLVGCEDVR